MSKEVVLNNLEHKDLKIDTRYCAEYGDNVNRTLAFSSEFGDLHKEYPILFHKNPGTNTFQAHVILGFDRNENLFLSEGKWQGNYIPAVLARGPFLIGFKKQETDNEESREPVVLVDLDNPRVGEDVGEAVFLPFGGDSPYLEKVMRILQLIHQGTIFDKTLFASLTAMDLIEPVSIKIKLSNIEQFNLNNYYSINEEKLAQLDGNSLEKLNRLGVLKLAFFALSSLGNINKLIELKNKKQAIAQ